jgi:hypothetical protein
LATRSSAGCSSSARPVPLASPLVVPPATCGESGGLHYDHCGRDGHVEAFCYWKKKAQKAQARRSSQGTSGTGFRGSDISYLVQRYRRFSCCFIALRPLRHQELLVL